MKKAVKLYLKFGILLFGISSLIISCDNDDYAQQKQIPILSETPTFKRSRISGSSIAEKSKLSETLKSINASLQINGYLKSTETYNSEMNFTIDTDVINYMEYGAYHSYTFPITRTIDSGLVENLLLSLQSDGNYLAYLVSYDLTDQEKLKIKNDELVDLDNKVAYTVLQDQNWANTINLKMLGGDSDMCIGYSMVTPRCSCNGKHSAADIANNTNNGAQCCEVQNGGVPEPYPVLYFTECPGTNSGGPSYTGPDRANPINPIFDDYGNPLPYNRNPSNSNPLPDNDNDDDQDDTDPQDQDNDCLQVDENGNCIGDMTTPIIPDDHDKNCQELQTESDSNLFRQRMQTLNDNVNGSVEKGFATYNGNYITPPSTLNPVVGNIAIGTAQEGPNLGYDPSQKSVAHNHLKADQYNHIGTFAPKDISQLVNLISAHLQQNSSVKKEELAAYLVCFEGNYAIKLNDLNKSYDNFAKKYAKNSPFFSQTFKDRIDKFYKDNDMTHGKPKNDQTIGFLELVKELDLGIELYEADDTFQNWKKLELDNNGNIKQTPC